MASSETRQRMKEIVRSVYASEKSEPEASKTLYTKVNINGKTLKLDNRIYPDELQRVRDIIVKTNDANSNNLENPDCVVCKNSKVDNTFFIRNYLGYQTLRKKLETDWNGYLALKNRLVAEKEVEQSTADKNIKNYFTNIDNEREF